MNTESANRPDKKTDPTSRAVAIESLETFVRRADGRGDPHLLADALFRLGHLYEEQSQQEKTTEGSPKAIVSYRRIARQFPTYRQLPSVYYFLGYALHDANREAEAQQVWRSLVCRNHFGYPTSGGDAERDRVEPLPGDNTEEYWTAWRKKYPTPQSLKTGSADVTFINPYPSDCVPLLNLEGLTLNQKMLAEVWWRIGEWETLEDVGSGITASEPSPVWGFNRAAAAFRHAMSGHVTPIYGVALYKYAWTLFKQERYQASVAEFVKLIDYDEAHPNASKPSFTAEAVRFIARALIVVDFAGPGEGEPYVLRDESLEETKLRVAITRVQDPRIIPQSRTWSVDIYRSLGEEYVQLSQYRSAFEVFDLALKKWPEGASGDKTRAALASAKARAVNEGQLRQRAVGK